VNAATPVADDQGNLFVSSEYGFGGLMLTVTPQGASRQWESKEIQSKFPQMILDRGHLYANSRGALKCMSWPDGAIKWKEDFELGPGGALVRAGDKLILMGDDGVLRLVRATPEKAELLSEVEVFAGDSQVWSTPLVYGGRLYAKGEKAFVCFDISGGGD
jgi:hypothetical protein